MELILFRNFNKRENSTLQPSGGEARDVKLKDNTSLENPTFIISNPDISYNYCKWLGRFYFINNIRLQNNNIYELDCTFDVLATYKSVIGNYNCLIERSSAESDNMLIDNMVSSSQNIISITSATTSQGQPALDTSGGYYILRVVGGSDTGIGTYAATNLAAFAPIFNRDLYLLTAEDPGLSKAFDLLFDPFDYVVSLQYMPITGAILSNKGSAVNNIWLKWYSIPAPSYKITDPIVKGSFTLTPNNYYQGFRAKCSNFTRHLLYLPGVGVSEIGAQDVANIITVNWTIDLYTGAISYIVGTRDSSNWLTTLATYSGSIASSIQIGSNATDYKNIAAGVANSIGGAVGAALTGNIGAAASSAAGVLNSITNYIMPTPSIRNSLSDALILRNLGSATLWTINYGTGESANSTFGRPLFKNRTINTIPGFVKCVNASINMPGFENDKIAVNNYLNGGFYYE